MKVTEQKLLTDINVVKDKGLNFPIVSSTGFCMRIMLIKMQVLNLRLEDNQLLKYRD